MKITTLILCNTNRRRALACCALASAPLLAPLNSAAAALETPFWRDGKIDFVFSEFKFALATEMNVQDACPKGTSLNLAEIYAQTAAGKRQQNESEGDYGKRLQQAAAELAGQGEQNVCMSPEMAEPDPFFKTLASTTVTTEGIDLDGEISADDFTNGAGVAGIDNQFLRAVGCSRSYQPSGLSNGFSIEMLSGSWGILLALSEVDDLNNDDSVMVTFFANADPIQLSGKREPLGYATYAYDQDARFIAQTRGRIREGVLTTEPVDVRFHSVVNSMLTERPLHAARIEARLTETGELHGVLAGFTPVTELYDLQFGFRRGEKPRGTLAPEALRMHSANGAAFVLGYTCQGAYQALWRLADGEFDNTTGRYNAISTQYQFDAIPAFIVNAKTTSANQELVENGSAADDY
ncbi:hypothetical protein [Halioxenophilus sp. WMMB6]|uniref:hypothetical protein n=1 Tax=Halioxenophilus sp. WMMB6 TaxID=3073815 RepID=UPI00295E2FD6|nr:hypothetical protein [Halioxenophilus sp. WMMB6]